MADLDRSRLGFIAELVLLAAPVSLFYATFLLLLGGAVGRPDDDGIGAVLVCSGVGLIGFWRLAIVYLVRDVSGLLAAHGAWWTLALVGVGVVGAGAIAFTTRGLPSAWVLGVLGLPLLVPIAHLAVLRIRVA